MAEQCASCGRADLLQPDIANYQCLACGALTSMATGKVIVAHPPVVNLSNMGYEVTELSSGVVETTDPGEERRERNIGPEPESVERVEEVVAPRPARVDEGFVAGDAVEPEVIDLSAYSHEQVAQIEEIIHE